MKFVAEIELGNETMKDPIDVLGAITSSMRRQVQDPYSPMTLGESGTISDVHGNTVGKWEVES